MPRSHLATVDFQFSEFPIAAMTENLIISLRISGIVLQSICSLDKTRIMLKYKIHRETHYFGSS